MPTRLEKKGKLKVTFGHVLGAAALTEGVVRVAITPVRSDVNRANRFIIRHLLEQLSCHRFDLQACLIFIWYDLAALAN
ncbi:MAG: hypothetical protein RMM51_01790 [Verrucomicrobiae bacterium]|nr:hypothetical protein [Verrucomicrobiae bacterium]